MNTHMMCFISTDLSLIKSSVSRGSRKLDVLLGTQCMDFLIISPSCFAGDFCSNNKSHSTDSFSAFNRVKYYYYISE